MGVAVAATGAPAQPVTTADKPASAPPPAPPPEEKAKVDKKPQRERAEVDKDVEDLVVAQNAKGDESGLDLPNADACTDGPAPTAPMPRRCHLSPNYRAGTAPWQRKIQALASLPPQLAAQLGASAATGTLVPPETTALAVDAQLDRDHIEGPGQVWLRIGLRSTDRWGMRRPPFDFAVVVGEMAAKVGDKAACKALEALAERVEPQDRFTLILGDKAKGNLDGIAGTEAAQRIRDLCTEPLAPTAATATTHPLARTMLGSHAAAQHRVAGTRVIVVIAAPSDLTGDLVASAAQGVQEPTLTSTLVLGEGDDTGWQLAGAGHGLLQPAPAGHEAEAAAALWRDWGRVVARLVRVDIRLATNVVALRVVGSRVLDAEETQRVRRQERAVDQNLARVAGVARDRDQDGEGMTMLIPAFLGSDAHFIDMLLQVQGPGAVADVVVDYKDLVRMTNQKAAARAGLERTSTGTGRSIGAGDPDAAVQIAWSSVRQFASALSASNISAMTGLAAQLARNPQDGGFPTLADAIVAAAREGRPQPALNSLLQLWIAQARGCRVAALTGS